MTVVQVPSVPNLAPTVRCCPRHPDWSTLAQHLVDAFPEATAADVVREIRAVRDAVMAVGVADDEALDVAETLARHRLSLLTGRQEDVARLDPQTRAKKA